MRLAPCLVLAVLLAAGVNTQASVLHRSLPQAIQVNPGQKIQTAINNAPVNSTIHVSAGTYFENLIVYKPIRLDGDSKVSAIIDGGGSGTVIVVNSSNVEISGFTLRDASSDAEGIYVKGASHVNVTDNIISAALNGDGASLDGSNNTIIANNIFSGNGYAVNVTNSDNNLIARNIATNNNIGVQLWNARHNTVANNTLDYGQSGLYLYKGVGNVLIRNSVVKNTETGVFLWASTNNTVIENSFEINRFGIDIQYSQNNTFYHNNLVSNTLYQVSFVSGSDRPVTTWDNRTSGCTVCVRAGNYWNNYDGTDNNGDGIGDTNLPANTVDNYPLMRPFAPLALAARAFANALSGEAPFTVTVTARVVGGTAPYSYHWDFGDGTTSSSSNSSHVFSKPVSLTVKLTVTDAIGASDQDSLSITVRTGQPTPVNFALVLGLVVGGGSVGAAGISLFWRKRHRRGVNVASKSPRGRRPNATRTGAVESTTSSIGIRWR